MWAANQATQGLGQISTTLADAQANASQYLTSAYDVGRDVSGTGYIDQLDALQAAYGAAPGMWEAGRNQARADLEGGMRTAYGQLETGRDYGLGQLGAGRDAAVGSLAGGRDAGISSLYGGRDAALDQLRAAYGTTGSIYGQARGDLNNYYGQATGTLQGAAAAYDPLIQRGMAGYDMYGNALGLGGQAGHDAATAAFQQGPGYEWQVNQATDAAQRAANKVGGLYGGNTADAVTRLSSNLANQEYQTWVKNLAPYQQAALAATTGKTAQLDELAKVYGAQGTALAGLGQNEASALTGIATNMANTYTGAGKDVATLYGNTGKQISDVYGTWGKQASDAYTTTGKQLSDISTATGTNLANTEMKTGAGLAALTTDEGRAYADTTGNYTGKLIDLASGYGGSMANLITGTAGQIAQAQQAANNTTTQAGTQGLLAGQQASANTWGAIFGGLQAGSKLLGELELRQSRRLAVQGVGARDVLPRQFSLPWIPADEPAAAAWRVRASKPVGANPRRDRRSRGPHLGAAERAAGLCAGEEVWRSAGGDELELHDADSGDAGRVELGGGASSAIIRGLWRRRRPQHGGRRRFNLGCSYSGARRIHGQRSGGAHKPLCTCDCCGLRRCRERLVAAQYCRELERQGPALGWRTVLARRSP